MPTQPADGGGNFVKARLDAHAVPVPRLLEYALNLIGLKSEGPGEKVEWWVDFTFRGQSCQVAHEKFGVRLYLQADAADDEARERLLQVAQKLRAAVRIVEKVVLAAAPGLLGKGDATVRNQHLSLDRAYRYFRERAVSPTFVATQRDDRGSVTVGSFQMKMNSFHDLVAAITAVPEPVGARPGARAGLHELRPRCR